MKVTKNEVIDAVNAQLAATDPRRRRLARDPKDAPVLHALLDVLLELLDSKEDKST